MRGRNYLGIIHLDDDFVFCCAGQRVSGGDDAVTHNATFWFIDRRETIHLQYVLLEQWILHVLFYDLR